MASSMANDVNIPQDEESHTHTHFKVAKFSHTWTISNFSFCDHKAGQYLKSVTFPLRGDEEPNTTKWHLKLYPKGYDEKYKEYLAVFFSLLAPKKSKVKAMLKVGVINAQGTRCTLGSSKENHEYEVNKWFGWQELVKQDYLLKKANGLMQDDKIVLFCEVKVLMEVSNTSESLTAIQLIEPKHHLLANIGHMLETKKLSDITLTACSKEFQAHKTILAAQSPVFSAMFEHNMEEKNQSRVNIIDMDDDVLQEMLLFIYTGEVKNIQKNAAGLLAAADKYALEKLKIMCEEALRVSLRIENAADTLILADLHSADHLKPRVISFIRVYVADVITTPGFKLLFLSYPSLITETFQRGNSPEISQIGGPASE